MGKSNFFKIACIVFFVALAGYSCWATEHSLHLLFQTVPEFFMWIVTVGFFIVASYGSKMIVDALVSQNFINNRRSMLIIGIVLLLIFWLFASMPTNTHTFFYNHKIGDVTIQDINTTQKYLKQIEDRIHMDSVNYNQDFKDLDDELVKAEQCYNGKGDEHGHRREKGGGVDFNGHLNNIMIIFCNSRYKGFDPKVDFPWNKHDIARWYLYQQKVNDARTKAESEYKVSKRDSEDAKKQIKKLDRVKNAIDSMVQIGKIDEDLILQTEGGLQSGYAKIKNNKNYVRFENIDDEKKYTADKLETDTRRMLSVFDVWADFLAGKYSASFWFYVLISILVDVAAFIFFDLAFKDDNSF